MLLWLYNHPFRALSESLITPLELKMEEWKKVASQLDKDHAKGRLVCIEQTGAVKHFQQLKLWFLFWF